MTDLTLRPTVIAGDRVANDYCVYFEGRSVGRIMLAQNQVQRRYVWRYYINPPIPAPSWADGSADSLDGAKAAFRDAWEEFYAGLSPRRLAHWHRVAGPASARCDY
jgi:hypothetical protein